MIVQWLVYYDGEHQIFLMQVISWITKQNFNSYNNSSFNSFNYSQQSQTNVNDQQQMKTTSEPLTSSFIKSCTTSATMWVKQSSKCRMDYAHNYTDKCLKTDKHRK